MTNLEILASKEKIIFDNNFFNHTDSQESICFYLHYLGPGIRNLPTELISKRLSKSEEVKNFIVSRETAGYTDIIIPEVVQEMEIFANILNSMCKDAKGRFYRFGGENRKKIDQLERYVDGVFQITRIAKYISKKSYLENKDFELNDKLIELAMSYSKEIAQKYILKNKKFNREVSVGQELRTDQKLVARTFVNSQYGKVTIASNDRGIYRLGTDIARFLKTEALRKQWNIPYIELNEIDIAFKGGNSEIKIDKVYCKKTLPSIVSSETCASPSTQ